MPKLTKDSLTDKIFDYIKNQILSGEWPANQKIPGEVELSETLGVSRMSLRMAIQKSNVLGLTETMVGDGTYARDFSMRAYFKEIFNSQILELGYKEINDFRSILEIGGIRLSFEKEIPRESIEMIENIYSKMEEALKAEDYETFNKCDFDFHSSVCSLCNNELMTMLYDAIKYSISKVTAENVEKSIKKEGSFERVLKYHRTILDGIKSRNLEQCIEAEMDSRNRSSYDYYRET